MIAFGTVLLVAAFCNANGEDAYLLYTSRLVPLSPKSSSDDGIHEELREFLKNSRETYSDFSIFGNKPSICIQKVAFGEMELVQKTRDGHPKTGGGKIWQTPYIKPCNYDDTIFSTCVKQQIVESLPYFTKGIPELGVPSLDPVILEDIVIDGNGLKLSLNKGQLHGLSTAFVNELKVNLKDETFSLKFVANMSVTGLYNIDGRILVLPIKGDGDCSIYCNNTEVEISSKITAVKSKNGEHLKLITPNYKYQIGNTTFRFENLFNGNKALADTMHQFANANWKQLMDDLAPPVIKQIVRTGVKSINKFFNKVTVQQLIVGYRAPN